MAPKINVLTNVLCQSDNQEWTKLTSGSGSTEVET